MTSVEIEETERLGRIAGHVRELLALLGVDPADDPEVAETPERVAELARELTAGLGSDPDVAILPDASAGKGLVIASGLEFHSLCAHHLLPFFGRAHVGYVPGDGVIGVGALGRVLDHFARRPQLQERLGEQVAEFLERAAGTRGVIVVLEARQLCMEMRGGRKRGTIASTAARGALAEGDLRREFFARIATEEAA